MKFITNLFLAFFILTVFVFSEDGFGVRFKGFVKTDMFYDTRQTSSIREGHFLVLPKPEVLDADGEDVNAAPRFDIISVQSRIGMNISAPSALGADISGYIEGAFFGSAEGNINTFRLRHAFVKMDWENSSLLVGQYWHPMFIVQAFPGVVSFNTGAPFQPFSRNPQVRFSQRAGDLELEAAACMQRDFQSFGPEVGGTASVRTAEFAADGIIPDLNFQARYHIGQSLVGAGAEYKVLRPRLETPVNYVSEETIGSFAAMAYAKVKSGDFSIAAEGVYGQNLANLTMLGGYGITSVETSTGIEEYTNLNTMSLWAEALYGKNFKIGLFGGYSQNLGSDDPLATGTTIYARGANVDYAYRISPRAIWDFKKDGIPGLRFAGELEYTAAAFGSVDYVENAEVLDAEDISNLRVLIACYVFF